MNQILALNNPERVDMPLNKTIGECSTYEAIVTYEAIIY